MIKKITALTLSVILIFSCFISLTSCGETSDTPKGMVLASNEIVDYYLYVPDSWTIDLAAGAVSAYYSESDPSSVSMMAWNIEDSETTLDSWWENNLKDFNLVFTNFNLESESNTVLDGVAAKQYVYTASLGENNYKFTQIAAMRKSMIYLFTYTSTAENYDSHAEDITKITENFKFN